MFDTHTSGRNTLFAALAAFQALFAAISGPVLADDDQRSYSVIYNARGESLGTIQGDGVTGREVIYDTRGRRVGTIDHEDAGQDIIRDPAGRRLGTVEQESSKEDGE